jgi:hypothetical protein
MRLLRPGLVSLAYASALALGGLCFHSSIAPAAVQSAITAAPLKKASPLSIKARHRHRKHRHRVKREREQPPELEKRPKAPERAAPQPSPPEAAKEASKPAEPMGPPPPPPAWTAAEIEAAKIDCDRRLSGLHALHARVDPIKEGACGSAAPIRLEGFESERAPDAYFMPAPLLSCKMAEALRRWFDDVVQRKAKAYLHATIVRIRTVSDYDCRPRYDDPAQRISQHAFANALDIAEFITAKGERIAVDDAWNADDERAAFLRDIHGGACEIFGTTLGPEANEAHRNHFHLDMIERRRLLCDFTPAQARAQEAARKAVVPASAPAPQTVLGGGKPADAKAETPVPAAGPLEPQRVSKWRLRRRRR